MSRRDGDISEHAVHETVTRHRKYFVSVEKPFIDIIEMNQPKYIQRFVAGYGFQRRLPRDMFKAHGETRSRSLITTYNRLSRVCNCNAVHCLVNGILMQH
ncbi:hypothetical protein ALC56_12808 [Trachymyrmex septentrionalis]|uniref:Uncharacterized protein n=1 Tax=Trachymyrmex septentrionalis TaxID=34720 RepID=A0A195EX48_9HYME|nr:hypothetical protein ALC56_12808 [Trachymyrmex septentrionalis]